MAYCGERQPGDIPRPGLPMPPSAPTRPSRPPFSSHSPTGSIPQGFCRGCRECDSFSPVPVGAIRRVHCRKNPEGTCICAGIILDATIDGGGGGCAVCDDPAIGCLLRACSARDRDRTGLYCLDVGPGLGSMFWDGESQIRLTGQTRSVSISVVRLYHVSGSRLKRRH